ncbi:hypothetical protein EDC01DRAFT_762544, partial [Geopyxis carbonaria]
GHPGTGRAGWLDRDAARGLAHWLVATEGQRWDYRGVEKPNAAQQVLWTGNGAEVWVQYLTSLLPKDKEASTTNTTTSSYPPALSFIHDFLLPLLTAGHTSEQTSTNLHTVQRPQRPKTTPNLHNHGAHLPPRSTHNPRHNLPHPPRRHAHARAHSTHAAAAQHPPARALAGPHAVRRHRCCRRCLG